MDVVHGSQKDFVPATLTHRKAGLAFKMLFEGSEHDRAHNHQLALVRQQDFFSPLHKHNFDQFRYAWKGDFSLGPNMTMHEGELCYHPEGVTYGPQTDDNAERILLLLQFGGASGQGYIGATSMRQANQELEKSGKFEGGRYYPDDGRHAVDGYQALWEHINHGQTLKYPPPRYQSPVVMKPQNFEWSTWNGEDGQAHGVQRKMLGVFSGSGTVVEQLKIDAGGHLRLVARNTTQFCIVRDGSGVAHQEEIEVESALRIHPGSSVDIRTDAGLTVLHYVMPVIESTP